MTWLFLWLACGLVAGYIYKNKGRSYLTAFLVGIIFGPIGIVLAAVTKPDTAGQERQALGSGMKKCPTCAELVKQGAAACRFCGHSFTAPAAATSVAPSAATKRLTESGSATCSQCGGFVRVDAATCRHCGRTFAV